MNLFEDEQVAAAVGTPVDRRVVPLEPEREEDDAEFLRLVESECSPAGKQKASDEALLSEALDAMLNLAPTVRRDRRGCFGNMQTECDCTACKIRRRLFVCAVTK